MKFYEDHKSHLQGPVGPTNSLDLPEVQEEEEPEEEATVPLLEPLVPPELPLPIKIEVQLPQAPNHYKEDFQVVDSDPMDLSALVTHLVTKATATVAAISPNGSSEPNTFKQALKHPLKNHWLKAAFSEIRQLLTTKTFYFVDRSEASKSPITSRWVFKEKKDSQGNVVKHKARLVVRGFQQVPGTDFTETFASTATPPTWRVVLAIAAVQDLEI